MKKKESFITISVFCSIRDKRNITFKRSKESIVSWQRNLYGTDWTFFSGQREIKRDSPKAALYHQITFRGYFKLPELDSKSSL
jgi:hypothetical protein